MSDPADQENTEQQAPRGEAAWKEQKDRIAARNAEAKKSGKERREAYEQQRETLRRGAEGREMARFMKSRRTP
jgi:hypothetical protein